MEIVATASFDRFVATQTDHFLIVRLDPFSSELAAGLERMDLPARARPRRNTISLSADDRTDLAATDSIQPPPRVRAHGALQCPPELLQAECFVTRLRKRSAEPPLSRVSIGRDPERDVLLQHPSVSRLHALIELAEPLVLLDPGSRNHTYVNGELVRDQAVITPGDILKLGAVRCSIVTASGLWKAVQS